MSRSSTPAPAAPSRPPPASLPTSSPRATSSTASRSACRPAATAATPRARRSPSTRSPSRRAAAAPRSCSRSTPTRGDKKRLQALGPRPDRGTAARHGARDRRSTATQDVAAPRARPASATASRSPTSTPRPADCRRQDAAYAAAEAAQRPAERAAPATAARPTTSRSSSSSWRTTRSLVQADHARAREDPPAGAPSRASRSPRTSNGAQRRQADLLQHGRPPRPGVGRRASTRWSGRFELVVNGFRAKRRARAQGCLGRAPRDRRPDHQPGRVQRPPARPPARLTDGRGTPDDETVNLAIPNEFHRKRLPPPRKHQRDRQLREPPATGHTRRPASTPTATTAALGRPGREHRRAWTRRTAAPDPISEAESRNMRALISRRQVTSLITNHTYTNLVLRPPGINAGREPAGRAHLQGARRRDGGQRTATF